MEELSRHFKVSTATIRRDVKVLEQEQIVVQTVGGGILYRQSGGAPPQGGDQRDLFIEEKIRIAEYCTELVEEHDEIIVGPGSTALIIGRILSGIGDRRFRIITNSLELAMETSEVDNIESVVIGGAVHGRYSVGSAHGSDYFASCHNMHKLIFSADGVDSEQGITVFDVRFLPLLKRMISVSSSLILAADSSKLGKVLSNKVADLDLVTTVVTDTNAPPELLSTLGAKGVSVVTV